MKNFLEKYNTKIKGVLSGFDRLIFKGTLRQIAYSEGMQRYLTKNRVLLKDCGEYFENKTKNFKYHSFHKVEHDGRPIIYLRKSNVRKKDYALRIGSQDSIKDGLICMLKIVEPCYSYDIFKNPETHKLELRMRERKCLFLYYYWQHSRFGFMGARIQTWFPFTCYIYINGREWLARMMDTKGIQYEKADNCFPFISDYDQAQRLLNKQLQINWPGILEKVGLTINPLYREFKKKDNIEYYWTVHQSEWATDIVFNSVEELSRIYGTMTRNAMLLYDSEDIMRFLGKKMHGNFMGEVTSDYKRRPEGIRIKHSIAGNSIKSYDKFNRILRVETTINNPNLFKVFRPKNGEDDKTAVCKLHPMRKSVADIYRRSRVSDECNKRYVEALSSLSERNEVVRDFVTPVCKPVFKKNRRFRALRLWDEQEQNLMDAISKPEYIIGGFRNKDIRLRLFGKIEDKAEEKKASAKVSRYFALLRAHGIIKKLPHSHRYQVTEKGRKIMSTVMMYRNITCASLLQAAA